MSNEQTDFLIKTTLFEQKISLGKRKEEDVVTRAPSPRSLPLLPNCNDSEKKDIDSHYCHIIEEKLKFWQQITNNNIKENKAYANMGCFGSNIDIVDLFEAMILNENMFIKVNGKSKEYCVCSCKTESSKINQRKKLNKEQKEVGKQKSTCDDRASGKGQRNNPKSRNSEKSENESLGKNFPNDHQKEYPKDQKLWHSENLRERFFMKNDEKEITAKKIVFYEGRDLLDLEANLKGQSWKFPFANTNIFHSTFVG